MERLFDPGSIAIVGASSDATKIGHVVLKNLISSGYPGRIYPVNPSAKEIMGLYCYPTVKSIQSKVDLCVIGIPALGAVSVLRECVDALIPYVIMIPGGFAETGKKGEALQNEVKDIISGKITRVIGPNTVGIYVPGKQVNTTPTPAERVAFPPDGVISFVSQSGALGLLTMDTISEFKTGINAFINIGNRADLDEIDFLRYFLKDKKTKAIALYVESIPRGREFYKALRETSWDKPVIILKSGRTNVSAKAAQLHTGSLATNDRVLDGILKQAGVIRVANETELLDASRALAYSKLPLGNRVVVITTAGGVGVLTVDFITSSRTAVLKIAELSDSLKEKIKHIILPIASAENPIDLTADGSVEQIDRVIGLINESGEADLVVLFALPQTPKMDQSIVDVIFKYKESGIPIIVGVLGYKEASDIRVSLEKNMIPSYPDVSRTVSAAEHLVIYSRYRRRLREVPL
ncbi:MAG: CoA-binding protein [Thermoplasmatales archaeon]|nr:CoA-binding protein [Thermoplasmatales archaeon]MCW6170618.1 CoA-binding protein [Thermoplasmatales archaeon]